MRRVAYVCADPGVPIFGCKGASVHVQEICRALLEAGHALTLFAARRGGESPPALRDVPVVDIPRPASVNPGAREFQAIAANRRVAEILDAAGPFDVVYERAALWSVAPMRHANRTGAVGILELNAPLLDEQARYRTLVHADTARRLLTTTLTDAHLVAAVSDGVAHWARRLAPAATVHVVPNGVDVRRFTPAGCERPRNHFVVGFVGTLKPWHGVETLVEAFARIAAQIPHARLKIVGDGPERPRIAAQLRTLGLLERAALTGPVSHADVPALLRTMDVAVAPYPPIDAFYFSPLKLTEYMAAGTAVVASGIGQVTSLIRHEETGLLFTPGDVRELAGALQRLHDDPGLGDRLAASARRLVEQRCTWASVARRIFSLAGLETDREAIGDAHAAVARPAQQRGARSHA